MDTLPGKTLDRYQVLDQIGRGGMAIVFKAWDPALNHHVALKVLRPHLASELEFIERFHREAQSAARLIHPHIVRVLNVGQQGETHFLVMDLIEGETLHHKIQREKKISLEAARAIVSQIGAALDYAHAQRLIHRDLKASNILLDKSGHAFLSDFGIARSVAGTQMTQTGMAVGTPEYMSPEQVMGKEIDGRSDLYSLGIVVYEMLTGHVPFTADSPASIMYRHVYTPPPMATVLNPHLPQMTNQFLQKALAKEPNDRFQSGQEMATAMVQDESVATLVQPSSPQRRAIAGKGVWGIIGVVVAVTIGALALRVALGGFPVLSQAAPPATQASASSASLGSPSVTRIPVAQNVQSQASPGSLLLDCGDLCVKNSAGQIIQLGLRSQFTFFQGGFSWSPDGKRVVFSACRVGDPIDGNGACAGLYVSDSNGLNVRSFVPKISFGTGFTQSPVWSPDGQFISYTQNGNLIIKRPDSTDPGIIVVSEKTTGCIAAAQWSPDSQQLAFIGPCGTLQSASGTAWLVNRDGTGLRAVYSDTVKFLKHGFSPNFAWNPDGTSIAFTLLRVGEFIQVDAACPTKANGCDESSRSRITEIPAAWFPTYYPQWDKPRTSP